MSKGIGKFIDDFLKNIQIWFLFPLESESPPNDRRPPRTTHRQDTFNGLLLLYVSSAATRHPRRILMPPPPLIPAGNVSSRWKARIW